MEILNILIAFDKKILLFLHGQGNPFWDKFWILITTPTTWIPFFILLYIFVYKAYGLKHSIIIAITTTLCVKTTLSVVNFIKELVQRARPINDESLTNDIRVLIAHSDYSFVSGHSAVSFAFAFLSFWILKPYYKYAYLVFIFPLLFAYSRIYLAAHFPLDIMAGMLLGCLIAFLFYTILKRFMLKSIPVI